MTILAKVREQILVLQNARESIAIITANIHESCGDMDIDTMTAHVEKATLPARNDAHGANQVLVRSLQSAIELYKNNQMKLSDFSFVLDSAMEYSKEDPFRYNPVIQQAKETVVTHTIKQISEYSRDLLVHFDSAPMIGYEQLKSDKNLLALYNETLDYLIKLGDCDAIDTFISSRETQFDWLQTRERFEQFINLISPNSAALLFQRASQLQKLIVAKVLQFNLLENVDFRQKILSLDIVDLQRAFAGADWKLADFESKPACDYQITWMMLTQDNVIPELLAQNKLEEYLDNLDFAKLSVLFEKFPGKILALLQENDLALSSRQQLARRLLRLDQKIVGTHAYSLIKLGIFQMDDSYDLAHDIDYIYENPLITDLLVANWTGWTPWNTYVNNMVNSGVSAKAFQFILSNVDILTHPNLRKSDIALCVKNAGLYLTPTTYLSCIEVLRTTNPRKMKQLLNLFPEFLEKSQKLAPEELPALLALATKYYELRPGKRGTANDPIMQALRNNKKFALKYAILGPMIFSEERPADLERFLNQAADYKIPDLISKEIVNGFANGMLMGMAGYGLLIALEKIAGVANNLVNPFAALQAVPAFIGNGFTMVAAGITAALTGGGVASTIALVIAPILASALIGGLVGALVNSGGSRIVDGVRRAGNWISNQVMNTNDKDTEIQEILIHGLKSANPQALRKRLYADGNTVMRDNLAKMLLQQQAKGFALQNLPAEILAIVEPIQAQYYDTNKSILLKAPDFVLGNILSAVAWTLNLLTLCVFDLNYSGPISRYLSYQNQKELAVKMSMPDAVELVAKSKTQAQIMQDILPSDPKTAYLNSFEEESSQPTTPASAPPPPYSPPSPRTEIRLRCA